jgi:hypothetical protein
MTFDVCLPNAHSSQWGSHCVTTLEVSFSKILKPPVWPLKTDKDSLKHKAYYFLKYFFSFLGKSLSPWALFQFQSILSET